MIFLHKGTLTSSTSEQELKDFVPSVEWLDRWEWKDNMPLIALDTTWIYRAFELGAEPATDEQMAILAALWDAKFKVTNGFYP